MAVSFRRSKGIFNLPIALRYGFFVGAESATPAFPFRPGVHNPQFFGCGFFVGAESATPAVPIRPGVGP